MRDRLFRHMDCKPRTAYRRRHRCRRADPAPRKDSRDALAGRFSFISCCPDVSNDARAGRSMGLIRSERL